MRAFGPYKNEEVIDFTQLKDNRLFVISGSTGAGKTTIFDGICFALYGSGSGQDRKDTKMLRSDFSEDDIHTAVELIFEIRGKTYRVLRQLPHVKKGRKSATGEKYELFEIVQSGEEIPAVERQRVTDINKKLEEIIGLTYDQFSQIVMLPQGEFRKLLTSQSENKEEILRKIFKTNRYGEIAQKLEEKKRIAEQRLNEAKVLKNSYIGEISGALPKREQSKLTTVINENSNIFQILEALQEERLFYEDKIAEDEKMYNESVEQYDASYKSFVANKQLNDRIDLFEKKKAQVYELEQQKPKYEQLKIELDNAIRASKIELLETNVNTLLKEKEQTEKRLIEAKELFQRAKENVIKTKEMFESEQSKQQERDEVSQRIAELEKLKPLYEKIDSQSKMVKSLQTDVENVKTSLETVEKQLAYKNKDIEKYESTIEQLESRVQNYDELLETQHRLKEIVQTFNKYDELEKNKKKAREQLETINANFEVAKETYEVEEAKWISNQASILAATLTEGEPCPVCGSLEHKKIHEDISESMNDSKLKQLKDTFESWKTKKITAEANVTSAVKQVQQIEEQLRLLHAAVTEKEQYTEQYNETTIKLQQCKQDRELLTEQKQLLKKEQEQKEQIEKDKKQFGLVYQQKNEQYIQQKTVLEQQQLSIPQNLQTSTELMRVLNELEQQKRVLFANWEKAQQQYHDAKTMSATSEEAVKQMSEQKEIVDEKVNIAQQHFQNALLEAQFESVEQYHLAKRTEKQQQMLEQQYRNYEKELHTLTIQVKEEEEQLNGVEKVDLTVAEEQLRNLKLAYEEALNTLNSSKEYEKQCIDLSDKLVNVADKIASLEEQSNQIVDVYNLLRGQNSKKISFERYVQMGYLEQITEAANIRLKNLSNGQYFLQCSDRQESHGRQSGLSLDVYDTYTGQSRDVKSLSGGEKFNASLSLALGMADVIQSFQGNVKIDTMFIDEGFGSLDEESLMKAIDTLIDLQKSGRMIGVISHVAELKAAIPAILNVEKLKEGYSRTSIIVK